MTNIEAMKQQHEEWMAKMKQLMEQVERSNWESSVDIKLNKINMRLMKMEIERKEELIKNFQEM